MKKVLLAFDGDNFSESAFEFACSLNKKDPILLTGVFISRVDAKNLWAYSVGVPPAVVPLLEEDIEAESENIERFEDLCNLNNITCRVHKDYYGFAIPGLKRETKFADVLLIGSETFYNSLGLGINDYMMNALHGAECPVLLIPESFIFPQRNILPMTGVILPFMPLNSFLIYFQSCVIVRPCWFIAKKKMKKFRRRNMYMNWLPNISQN